MSGNLTAAMTLHRKGRLREAELIYKKILQTHPDEVNSLQLLGAIRLAEGDAESACVLISRAVELRPDYAEAHLNLGSVWRALGQPQQALASYDAALALRADLVDAHYNRGVVLQESGALDAALASYRMVDSLQPRHAEGLSNAALIHLLRGDLATGWPLYEWRLATPQFLAAHPQPLPGARWTGREPLAGKHLLVFCEQGLGDAIQFARYLPLLARQGATITVLCRAVLHRLFARIAGVTQVTEALGDQRFDLHVPLLSLPGIFGTRLDGIPAADVAYLSIDRAWLEPWRERLGTTRLPRIGLMWSGGNVTRIAGRSTSLATLGKLLELPCEFISLQRDLPREEQELLARMTLPDTAKLRHFGSLQEDLADAAALIELVDLVVSVDTSVAHLAASLGKETWILLPKVSDWRWLEGRNDSPWYRSARLWRQATAGDWHPVVGEIQRALQARFAG
jgi:Tfp pilus assembly protein PilF